MFLDSNPERERILSMLARPGYSWHLADSWRVFSPRPRGTTIVELPNTAIAPGGISAGALRVCERTEREERRVYVDGPLGAVPMTEFFALYVRIQALQFFEIDAGYEGRRLKIGQMIVRRAEWIREGRDIPRFDRSGSSSYRRMLAWLREMGAPRYLFVKVPHEKPLYVDSASPGCMENLRRALHDAPRARISEMLPAPEALWMRNSDDAPCTSELRLVFEPRA
jgi:hypothetical protein